MQEKESDYQHDREKKTTRSQLETILKIIEASSENPTGDIRLLNRLIRNIHLGIAKIGQNESPEDFQKLIWLLIGMTDSINFYTTKRIPHHSKIQAGDKILHERIGEMLQSIDKAFNLSPNGIAQPKTKV